MKTLHRLLRQPNFYRKPQDRWESQGNYVRFATSWYSSSDSIPTNCVAPTGYVTGCHKYSVEQKIGHFSILYMTKYRKYLTFAKLSNATRCNKKKKWLIEIP